MTNNKKLEELAKLHGEGIANPVLRSMISSMSRYSYALVLAESYKAGYLAAQKEAEWLVEALKFYDNIHRNHWACDLNDLEKVAMEALKKYESGE